MERQLEQQMEQQMEPELDSEMDEETESEMEQQMEQQMELQSLELKKKLVKMILAAKQQVLPFADFMQVALYEPQLGFYSNGLQKFGQQGHFVTAPTLGRFFARSIARQITEIFNFDQSGYNILELGGGDGSLAVNLLEEIGDSLEHYYLLEPTAALAAHQKSAIRAAVPQHFAKVVWITALPAEFTGVVIANEVLDALPFNRVRYRNEGQDITGLGVGWNGNNLIEQEYVLDELTLAKARSLNLSYSNYDTEINVLVPALLTSIADMLSTGAVIFIDYGCGQREYYAPNQVQGRVRGFFAHKVYSNVFSHLGLMDITTDVNFTELAWAGVGAGLDLIGYTNQGAFLLNCNADSCNDIFQNITVDHAKQLHELQTLISPVGMGAVFKVMGFSKGLEPDQWLGFASHDLTHQL